MNRLDSPFFMGLEFGADMLKHVKTKREVFKLPKSDECETVEKDVIHLSNV